MYHTYFSNFEHIRYTIDKAIIAIISTILTPSLTSISYCLCKMLAS